MPTASTDTVTKRLLVAEDDPEIRRALQRILDSEGYETIGVDDGAAALAAVADHELDAIVLDLMLPFVDGMSVCRRIRDHGVRTPVLVLTARHGLEDRVAGLDAGADDYVTKPFELDELLARLRALLRRSGDGGAEIYAVGPLQLDVRRRRVLVAGDTVELTRTEFAILALLMRNADLVLSRSTMYDRIWGYDFEGGSRALDVHVGSLRRKLESNGTPRMIETVRGVGFVLRPD